jgi:hypothetical protein
VNISIIGTGYVGLVTGTCLADFGIAVGIPRQVPPSLRATEQTLSLRATEGNAAIPPSVIPTSLSVIPACLPHRQAEAGIHSSVIAREQSDRSNPNLNRRTGVSPVYNVIARSEVSLPLRKQGKQSQPSSKSFYFDLVSNPEFRNLDLLKIKKLLKSPILLDLRNLYEPAQVKELGFTYEGVGRK